MPLSDDIHGLAGQVLDRVDEAREFYVHSRQAWRLVQQLARKGRPGLMPVRNARFARALHTAIKNGRGAHTFSPREKVPRRGG